MTVEMIANGGVGSWVPPTAGCVTRQLGSANNKGHSLSEKRGSQRKMGAGVWGMEAVGPQSLPTPVAVVICLDNKIT